MKYQFPQVQVTGKTGWDTQGITDATPELVKEIATGLQRVMKRHPQLRDMTVILKLLVVATACVAIGAVKDPQDEAARETVAEKLAETFIMAFCRMKIVSEEEFERAAREMAGDDE